MNFDDRAYGILERLDSNPEYKYLKTEELVRRAIAQAQEMERQLNHTQTRIDLHDHAYRILGRLVSNPEYKYLKSEELVRRAIAQAQEMDRQLGLSSSLPFKTVQSFDYLSVQELVRRLTAQVEEMERQLSLKSSHPKADFMSYCDDLQLPVQLLDVTKPDSWPEAAKDCRYAIQNPKGTPSWLIREGRWIDVISTWDSLIPTTGEPLSAFMLRTVYWCPLESMEEFQFRILMSYFTP